MDLYVKCAMEDSEWYGYVEDILTNKEFKHMMDYKHHIYTTCLEHCIHVSYSCFCRNRHNKFVREIARGSLLHDFYMYNYHKTDMGIKYHLLHGFYHPFVAYYNACALFEIGRIEADIIQNHMWPLTLRHIPKTIGGVSVVFYDKVWALREVTMGMLYKLESVYKVKKGHYSDRCSCIVQQFQNFVLKQYEKATDLLTNIWCDITKGKYNRHLGFKLALDIIDFCWKRERKHDLKFVLYLEDYMGNFDVLYT